MFHGIRTVVSAEIADFCDAAGMSEREFGIQFAHDARFVSRLRGGMSIGLARLEDISRRVDCYKKGDTDTAIPGRKAQFRPGLYRDRLAA